MSVLYQDSAIDPIDTALAEPAGASNLSVRARQHHIHRRPRLQGPETVDAPPHHGTAPDGHLKVASVVPLHHPVSRHHGTHAIGRLERGLQVRQPGAFTKRVVDILGALTLAIVLLPVLLVVVLALARDRGPIIYKHSRTGRNGRPFGCLKFRTMVPNAEQLLQDLLQQDPKLRIEWLRDHKLRDDPRVTIIGRFLRRTSLDELPQLWNVLKGDMSLVGPRPVVREEWQRYGRHINTYLTAKPGVTGLWQIKGRSDCCYRKRVALDTYYIRKRTLSLDVFILLQTVNVVLRGRGAC
jgi:exopolysaccharide production protein ExoY